MIPGLKNTMPLAYVTPGSQVFNTPGNTTFKVPYFSETLRIRVWGAGGGGMGATAFSVNVNGDDGGYSRVSLPSIGTLTANGGKGPIHDDEQGEGGTASGGTINTTGGDATTTRGGDSPNGGNGGTQPSTYPANGNNGNAPGGGGSGCNISPFGFSIKLPGGGGGGYCERTYTVAQLATVINTNINITIGAGGQGGNDSLDGGNGANGRIEFIWS